MSPASRALHALAHSVQPARTSGDGHASEIAALQTAILACRACQQAGHIRNAAPVRQPWTPMQRTMIVGQAPGAQTEVKRYHFAGPGGQLLGRWLTAAGYPAETWREHCYITSMTRCFPGKNSRGQGDRKPSPAELALCRPFLEAELQLVRPKVVLLLGTLAIDSFLGRHPLEAVVGTIHERDGRLFLPLPHPSPVSRWLNHPDHRRLVDRALTLLAETRARLDL